MEILPDACQDNPALASLLVYELFLRIDIFVSTYKMHWQGIFAEAMAAL